MLISAGVTLRVPWRREDLISEGEDWGPRGPWQWGGSSLGHPTKSPGLDAYQSPQSALGMLLAQLSPKPEV